MTKDQWANCVHVMNLKWPNFNWENDTVIAAYDSLKTLDVYYVERAIEQSFKSGSDFPPNPSNIYATAMEIQRYESTDVPQLPQERGISMQEYLQSMNYESFTHAMYESGRKRFLEGKSEVYEDFDYSKEWSKGGKEAYFERFGNASSKLSQMIEKEVESGFSE
tara:strand:+ start:1068 stop:1559 length:492 start_codon:yes stop_codon:yes gene_type:complete